MKYYFDTNSDGYLSKKERNNATLISAKYWKISSFKGIKYFPNLKYLDCGHNNLTSLDLSGNKKLENSTVIIISLQLCRPETHRNSEHCIVVIIA